MVHIKFGEAAEVLSFMVSNGIDIQEMASKKQRFLKALIILRNGAKERLQSRTQKPVPLDEQREAEQDQVEVEDAYQDRSAQKVFDIIDPIVRQRCQVGMQ